jgi:hypothetical protein
MHRVAAFIVLGAALLGCDDKPREDTPPVRYYSDVWRESTDNIHDGALRVGAYTFQEGRRITVRCFGHPGATTRKLDIRYTIEVPLLRRLENDFKDNEGLTLNVAADSNVSRILRAQPGIGEGALWFLADADRELVESLANAKRKIFVVPTLNGQKLDGALEFGAAYAKKHINAALEACRPTESAVLK